MRIGQAARISGTSVRALRHYEEEGLITPGRLANGYRDYCPTTVATVLEVRSLLEAGLPVRLIREALPHLADDRPAPGAGCVEFLREVERHRDRLAARAAALTRQQRALDAYLRRARGRRDRDAG